MAKVVKFCAACEEGFAEKFGFCPNCGGTLTAYELNPVGAADQPNGDGAPTKTAALFDGGQKAPAPAVVPVVSESPAVFEATSQQQPVTEAFSADDDFLEINDEREVESAPEYSSTLR